MTRFVIQVSLIGMVMFFCICFLVGCGGGGSELGIAPQVTENGNVSFWVGKNVPLQQVMVRIYDQDINWEADIVTDSTGHATLTNVSPGKKLLEATSKDGRQSKEGLMTVTFLENIQNNFTVTFDGWNKRVAETEKLSSQAINSTSVDVFAEDFVPEIVDIYILNESGKEVFSGKTNQQGRLDDVSIPTGNYTFRAVDANGIKTEMKYLIVKGDNVITFAF